MQPFWLCQHLPMYLSRLIVTVRYIRNVLYTWCHSDCVYMYRALRLNVHKNEGLCTIEVIEQTSC